MRTKPQFLPYALRRLVGHRKWSQSKARAPIDPNLVDTGKYICRLAGVQIPEIFWHRIYNHYIYNGPPSPDPAVFAAICSETGEASTDSVSAWTLILIKIKARRRDAWHITSDGLLHHDLLDEFERKSQKNH